MSVCLHTFISKSNVDNVRITNINKVICYMGILFLFYYRGHKCDEGDVCKVVIL